MIGSEFYGAIAAVFGAAIGAWLLDRWLGVRVRIGNWWRTIKSRKATTEAMVSSWPTALAFIEGAQSREERAAARDVRITAEFASLHAKLDNITARQWGQMKLDPQARFQCDHSGANEQVNSAYAGTMRVGEFDLMGYGWKNRVVEEDLPEYEAAAAKAFREHRKFERTVRLQRGDGTRFRGLVRIEPYPEDPADLADGRHPMWFGSVVVVEDLP